MAAVTSDGAFAAAAWLAASGPRGSDHGRRLTAPLLLACRVAANGVDLTLCAVGTVLSGAGLVRVLAEESVDGPAATYFATEALRRAGTGVDADPAVLAAAIQAQTDLREILALALGRFPGKTSLAFGPGKQYKLTAAQLGEGYEQAQATIRRAVRTLFDTRPDLLAPPEPFGGSPIEVLLFGRIGFLPWVGAAARDAVAAALAGVGQATAPEAVPTHVATPQQGIAKGREIVARGSVVVEERRSHTVRLQTHRLADGHLHAASLPVAVAGDDWPTTALTDGVPVTVQVDGSVGGTVRLEVGRAGRVVIATTRLPGELAPGVYHLGLVPGREPAGSLVLRPAAGDAAPHVLAISGFPDD